MPIFENNSGLNFTSIPEHKMDKILPRREAIVIYCVGNGFGKTEGFENYFKEGNTYKQFIEKLVGKGILIKKR